MINKQDALAVPSNKKVSNRYNLHMDQEEEHLYVRKFLQKEDLILLKVFSEGNFVIFDYPFEF